MRSAAALLLGFAMCAAQGSSGDGTVIIKQGGPFHFPELELVGRLGRTLALSKCEAISGITCVIALKAGEELPSKVFISDVDSQGHESSNRIRMIYPQLKAGEQGRATIGGNVLAPRLRLRGEWNADDSR